MNVPTLDRRRGGIVTLVGYLVVLAVLFRDPSRVLDAASTVQGVLFFLALPLAGLASGAYAAWGGPYSGVGLFVAGSYLAVVGLTFGFGLVSVSLAVSAVGFVLFVLAVVAVLAGFQALWAYFQIDVPGEES